MRQLLVIIALTASCANAATLVGSGTLYLADDLTVIQTSGGAVMEWIDLTSTTGMTVEDAVAAYQTDGFRWATGSDVSALFSAFGIIYSNIAGSTVFLDVSDSAANNFVLYLGDTFGHTGGNAGWIDDFTTETHITQSCIGAFCSPSDFIVNHEGAPQSWGSIGIFLVRDVDVVPIPAAAWLFGSALLGLGWMRKKKA